MPLIKSAIKRMHQTAKRRARNIVTKRNMRSAIKDFLTKPSSDGFKAAQSELDTAVKKNLMEKNTAARRKARLVRVAKEAGVKVDASAKIKKAVAKTVTKTPEKAATKAPAKTAKPAAKKPAAKKAVAKKPAAK